MGIKGLTKVINDHAPSAIKSAEMKTFFGRKVAVDASMSIYQFLIAVRLADGAQLMNEDGETTSHLIGLFYRTIRMVDNGLKPCYVFDGSPPELKSGELAKRGEKRKEANDGLEKAVAEGDQENINKFSRRTVKVTKKHNEECQQLLDLMGIPWIQAPCEAEAQCAELAKAGKVYGVGSEDMDTLTFAAPVLMRHLTFSEAKKAPVVEINLEKLLKGLEMTHEQFIDLCILLGCDYCDSIKGIGPTRAVSLIKEHKTLENILEHLDPKKHPVPEDWPYQEARELFKNPKVQNGAELDLKWKLPDKDGLMKFLVTDRSFSEERISKGIEKLTKAKKNATQGRLDSFFKVIPKEGTKRKVDQKKEKPSKKGKKH